VGPRAGLDAVEKRKIPSLSDKELSEVETWASFCQFTVHNTAAVKSLSHFITKFSPT
jgi:hypothetical protein